MVIREEGSGGESDQEDGAGEGGSRATASGGQRATASGGQRTLASFWSCPRSGPDDNNGSRARTRSRSRRSRSRRHSKSSDDMFTESDGDDDDDAHAELSERAGNTMEDLVVGEEDENRSSSPVTETGPGRRSRSQSSDNVPLLTPRLASRSQSHSPSALRPGKVFTEVEIENLAEQIAQKVFFKKQEKDDREKAEAERKGDGWEEGTEWLVCKPCSAQGNAPDVPYVFRTVAQRGAHYGMVNKKDPDGQDRPRWRLNRAIAEHAKSSFHLWCLNKDKEVKRTIQTFEEENRDVGIIVNMVFLKVARRGGSASDFQNDIDFLHLLPQLAKSQKNNSHNTFFELRNDAFEVVTETVQELFKGSDI